VLTLIQIKWLVIWSLPVIIRQSWRMVRKILHVWTTHVLQNLKEEHVLLSLTLMAQRFLFVYRLRQDALWEKRPNWVRPLVSLWPISPTLGMQIRIFVINVLLIQLPPQIVRIPLLQVRQIQLILPTVFSD